MARAKADIQPFVVKELSDEYHRTNYSSALDKKFEKLNANERAAVKKHHETAFQGTLRSCRRTLFTEILESSSYVILDNRDRRGFPWPEGKNTPVDGRQIIRFLWRYFLENKPSNRRHRAGASVEEILLEGASPELRDQLLREQILEKQLQRELKELELARESEAHLPTEKCQEVLADAARLIAKKREYLERVVDGDAKDVVSRAFEDLADDIQSRAVAIVDGRSDEEFDELIANRKSA